MRRTHPERALEAALEDAAIAPDGAALLVACSGGPDSVALSSLLARSAPKHGWRLVLGHVNHHVRESSWQDEAVVLSVGAALGLPVEIRVLESVSRRTDEAALREARYEALAEMAVASNASVVVTAHTAEDQTETVLLALFRGTGLRGLGGMPARRVLRRGIDLVRPLLHVGKAALRVELGASALPYAVDPTNASPSYRRNAVRAALSGLRAELPHLDEAVARCAAIVAAELADTERAAARRRLREALEQEVGLADVSFERIEAALRARRGRVHLKAGVEAVKKERNADPRVVRRRET
jgi:tRNA(Ile)-lysidine synthase